MHEHRRPGLSSSGAQRLSAPPGWTTVSTLCRSPDAKVACGCTAQRRARSLASGARRACPGWPLSGTSDFTEGDWVGVKRCQTYLTTRLNELYTAMAAQNCLRPSCDHEVVGTKAGYDQRVNPVIYYTAVDRSPSPAKTREVPGTSS